MKTYHEIKDTRKPMAKFQLTDKKGKGIRNVEEEGRDARRQSREESCPYAALLCLDHVFTIRRNCPWLGTKRCHRFDAGQHLCGEGTGQAEGMSRLLRCLSNKAG